jgi:hypothetical protein
MRSVKIFPFSCALPLLLGLSVVFGDCGPKFGGKCSCGGGQYQEKNEQYIVNCTNTGFNNTAVLQHIPPQTQVGTKSYCVGQLQPVHLNRKQQHILSARFGYLESMNNLVLILHFSFRSYFQTAIPV